MRKRILFAIITFLLIPSCRYQPSSEAPLPSMKESHTSDKQREQIQDRLSKVLNKANSSPEEISASVQPYLGVLYEFATSDDVEMKLLSQHLVNLLSKSLLNKTEGMKSKGMVEDESWLKGIFADMFEINNMWNTEITDNAKVFTHYRLSVWAQDILQYYLITVVCVPDTEPVVAIDFPAEALGTPIATFSNYADEGKDIEHQVRYDLPSWDGIDSYNITAAKGDFLDLMLSKEYMFLSYINKADKVEIAKIPLSAFQIAYRDAMVKHL